MIDRPVSTPAFDPLPVLAVAIVGVATAAPWALGFSANHAAVAGHMAFAMAFGPVALLIGALAAAAATMVAAGASLVAGTWVLGYAALRATAWTPDVLAGVALVALGLRAWRRWDQPGRLRSHRARGRTRRGRRPSSA